MNTNSTGLWGLLLLFGFGAASGGLACLCWYILRKHWRRAGDQQLPAWEATRSKLGVVVMAPSTLGFALAFVYFTLTAAVHLASWIAK